MVLFGSSKKNPVPLKKDQDLGGYGTPFVLPGNSFTLILLLFIKGKNRNHHRHLLTHMSKKGTHPHINRKFSMAGLGNPTIIPNHSRIQPISVPVL